MNEDDIVDGVMPEIFFGIFNGMSVYVDAITLEAPLMEARTEKHTCACTASRIFFPVISFSAFLPRS
jgi:hypothetical protein